MIFLENHLQTSKFNDFFFLKIPNSLDYLVFQFFSILLDSFPLFTSTQEYIIHFCWLLDRLFWVLHASKNESYKS